MRRRERLTFSRARERVYGAEETLYYCYGSIRVTRLNGGWRSRKRIRNGILNFKSGSERNSTFFYCITCAKIIVDRIIFSIESEL